MSVAAAETSSDEARADPGVPSTLAYGSYGSNGSNGVPGTDGELCPPPPAVSSARNRALSRTRRNHPSRGAGRLEPLC
jgi:hypothetical protein